MEKISFGIPSPDKNVTLSGYHEPDGAARPAVIVLPGGAYNFCAPREGEPVAAHFAKRGYAALVLNYSTRFGSPGGTGGRANPHTVFPGPLRQAAEAVRTLRSNAEALNIDPERIVLMGFSAGGHLAGCYSNLWHTRPVFSGIADSAEALRPNACVLVYAALELSAGSDMARAICGENAADEAGILKGYTPKNLVSPLTPPTFMFHSVTDPAVPAASTENYARALEDAGIAHDMRLFPEGGHAYGAAEGEPAGVWTRLADEFIKRTFEPR